MNNICFKKFRVRIPLFIAAVLMSVGMYGVGFTPTDGGLVVNLKPGDRILLSVWLDINDNGIEEPGEEFFVSHYSSYTGGWFGYTKAMGNTLKLIPQSADATEPSATSIWTIDTALVRPLNEQMSADPRYPAICYTMWSNDGYTLQLNGNYMTQGAMTNNKNHTNTVDVVFVDEAHLLWTQGKQSYRGKNQLEDLRRAARVTVIMFDEHQTLHTQEYWDPDYVSRLRSEARNQIGSKGISYYFELKQQLRIQGSQETMHWIRNFTDHLQLDPIPADENYDLRVFDSPKELEQAIRARASHEHTKLSRILATFDWDYIDKKKPEQDDYWYVTIGDWKMPWNLQLPRIANGRKQQKQLKEMSWAEQPVSLNEVGSTFTIQGFDLNYAGVILGPSVKYRNGKIVIDPSRSADKKATQFRTLADGSRAQFGREFIRNEINVLLTRGVQGLYLYAVDDELRAALLKAAGPAMKRYS